jgi:hypothetical protein
VHDRRLHDNPNPSGLRLESGAQSRVHI